MRIQELARKYPDRAVPITVLEDVVSGSRRSAKVLLIDLGDVSALDKPAVDSQESLLGDEGMLTLEGAIKTAKAAGRSSIHAMEGANRIFGVLPPGRIRGKRYPKWQFSPGVAGEPLRRILAHLNSVDAWAKYQFFSSAYPELGHLTPIEILTGSTASKSRLTDETRALLNAPHEKRVRLIEELAEGFSNSP